MIRFIDLGNQISAGEREFAFYDTVIDKFCTFSDTQTWDCIEDFVLDFDKDNIDRYLNLMPTKEGS